MYYDVRSGSLRPLSENLSPAIADIDFRAVYNGNITFYDGQSSAAIVLQALEDNEPEVDEVFVVSLTRVELLQPRNSTFRPSLGE